MADKEINSITTTPSDLTSFGDDSNTLAFNVDDGTAKPVEVSTPESISKSNKSTIEEIAMAEIAIAGKYISFLCFGLYIFLRFPTSNKLP